jgi:hypothetical protein
MADITIFYRFFLLKYSNNLRFATSTGRKDFNPEKFPREPFPHPLRYIPEL